MTSQHLTLSREREIVLIVDDTPANLSLLVSTLSEFYDIRTCIDGHSAIQLVQKIIPDLILLDIKMPGISGFEVYEQLLQKPQTAQIPVIFISALNDLQSETMGLKMGAVDYIAKPFNSILVQHRVENQLRIKRFTQKIAEDYQKLQTLEKQRDDLTRMIIHDLRSPLSGISTAFNLFKNNLSLSDREKEILRAASDTTNDMQNMISSLLDISRMEEGKFPVFMKAYNLDTEIQNLITQMSIRLNNYQFEYKVIGRQILLTFDSSLIVRILQNLLDNAIKFTPKQKPISLYVYFHSNRAEIHVKDSGFGIPLADQAKIFEKFGQLENGQVNARNSSGLGLTFCKLAMEAMGGTIQLESSEGIGSNFILTIPIQVNQTIS